MRGFDAGTAGLTIGLITFIFLWYLHDRWQENSERISRMEKIIRSHCAGDKQVEYCARMDLPLKAKKFVP